MPRDDDEPERPGVGSVVRAALLGVGISALGACAVTVPDYALGSGGSGGASTGSASHGTGGSATSTTGSGSSVTATASNGPGGTASSTASAGTGGAGGNGGDASSSSVASSASSSNGASSAVASSASSSSSASSGASSGSGGASPCVAEISASYSHTCARKVDGTLWCWGDNTAGQIGDGTTTSPRATPVQITALGSSVAQVATTRDRTCARKTDGTLWCWGRNTYGEIGDGSTGGIKSAPTRVVALGSDVAEVSTGASATCARKTDGTVWCWGNNSAGTLGDGTTVSPKPNPTQAVALGNTVSHVSVSSTGCAIKADGTLWCWGYNVFGQLGDGTMVSPRPTPAQVVALGNTVAEVVTADNQVCARKTDGTAWCWGYNGVGQLGDGTTTTPRPTPEQVAPLGTSVTQIASGYDHSCAIKTDASLWCWGSNVQGQLGNADPTSTPYPLPLQASAVFPHAIIGVATGSSHTCALEGDGTVWCFGDDSYGELGDGPVVATMATPVKAALTCP